MTKYVYHIIGQAGEDGQQTVEIIAESLNDALQVYIDHSITDECESIT